MFKQVRNTLIGACAGLAVLLSGGPALAHCDGLDGPVVNAAREALETGDVTLVLIWVQPDDEAEIQAAFADTMAVRGLSPAAEDLADRYFFETLVRLHRAGEGAPYTGLKPAGRDLGPAIPAADGAIESGDLNEAATLLTEAVEHGLHAEFEALQERRGYDPSDVEAGREYVEAYVSFIHYAERIYEAAVLPAEGHYPEDH
jgi:hypothetical protein